MRPDRTSLQSKQQIIPTMGATEKLTPAVPSERAATDAFWGDRYGQLRNANADLERCATDHSPCFNVLLSTVASRTPARSSCPSTVGTTADRYLSPASIALRSPAQRALTGDCPYATFRAISQLSRAHSAGGRARSRPPTSDAAVASPATPPRDARTASSTKTRSHSAWRLNG